MNLKTPPSRSFCVVAIADNLNSFGLRGHVLVSRSGEAYEVGRSDFCGAPRWRLNGTVAVPMREVRNEKGEKFFDLNWAAVNCEIPRRLPAPPRATLRSIFSAA